MTATRRRNFSSTTARSTVPVGRSCWCRWCGNATTRTNFRAVKNRAWKRPWALRAAIDLDVVHSGIVRLSALKPGTLFGTGKVDEFAGMVAALEAGIGDRGSPADAGAAAQSGEGAEREGAGPDRAHSRDFRRAGADERRAAAGRTGPPQLSERADLCGRGPTWNGSAVVAVEAAAFWAVPARRRSRVTVGSCRSV